MLVKKAKLHKLTSIVLISFSLIRLQMSFKNFRLFYSTFSSWVMVLVEIWGRDCSASWPRENKSNRLKQKAKSQPTDPVSTPNDTATPSPLGVATFSSVC